MARLKNVLLLIESSRSYGRDCLLGVARYLRSHGGWRVLNIERGLTEHLPRLLCSWSGDGVIVRIENAKIAAAIAGLNVPAVDLRGSFPPPGGAMFDTDARAVGKMAADHFLELGFRHFAFCGFAGVDFSDCRRRAYQEYLSDLGLEAHEHRTATAKASRRDVLDWELRGELATEELGAWLRSLPRPLAIFACNDVRGRQVIEACNQAGIAVPEEVAVLGVDDDEVICELSSPPLSSIRPNAQKLGFDGAAMLDHLMAGGAPPDEAVLIPPKGVSRRLSSEMTAVEDRDVAAAIQFIRDHGCQGINVHDVVAQLAISRSSLERRFQLAVGKSPAAEIERVRMTRAKVLLAETTYGLEQVARLTGFGSASQFAAAFKRYAHVTPGQFRTGSGH